jgi:hypothetical protein
MAPKKNKSYQVNVYFEEGFDLLKVDLFCKPLEKNGVKAKKVIVTKEPEEGEEGMGIFNSLVYQASNESYLSPQGIFDCNRLIMASHGCVNPYDRQIYRVVLTQKKLQKNSLTGDDGIFKDNRLWCISTHNGVNLKEIAGTYLSKVVGKTRK